MGMSLGTMCRLFLFQMLLTMLFALPMTSAHAQRHGGGQYGGGYGGQQTQAQTLQAQLRLHTRGHAQIAVMQEVRMATGVSLQGKKLLKVIVKASSMQGHASAQLLIDGMRVGYSKTISRYEDRIVFDVPRYGQNIIGRDIRSVQIALQGNIQTKMVALKVQGSYMGGGQVPRVISMSTYERVRGSQRLSLEQLVGYNRALQGQLIQEVTIQAQGQGSIIAVARGQQLGSISVGSRSGMQTIRLYGDVVASDILLRMTGNMTVTSVQVKVARQYNSQVW